MDDDDNGKSEFLLELLVEAGRDALGLAEKATIHGLIDPSVTAVASLAPRDLNSTW